MEPIKEQLEAIKAGRDALQRKLDGLMLSNVEHTETWYKIWKIDQFLLSVSGCDGD